MKQRPVLSSALKKPHQSPFILETDEPLLSPKSVTLKSACTEHFAFHVTNCHTLTGRYATDGVIALHTQRMRNRVSRSFVKFSENAWCVVLPCIPEGAGSSRGIELIFL